MIQGHNFNYDVFCFPCGEMQVKIKDFMFIERTHLGIRFHFEKNEEIIQLLLLVNAIEEAGLTLDFLELSYVPFSRQDRVVYKGEAFALKVFANIINSLNIKVVYIDDPHSDVATALIKNCVVRTQVDIFEGYLKELGEFYLISPDGGSLKKIYKISEKVDCIDVIECSKKRNLKTGEITETKVYHDDFKGKDCVIVDDICDGGRTFIEIAKVLKAKNARKVVLMVTHGFFTKGMEVFDGLIDEIYTKEGRIT